MRFAGLLARELPCELILYEARSWRSRALGLALLPRLHPGHGLVIDGCGSVHTFGMRFAIDILFLDGRDHLLRLDEGVRPRRIRSCRGARFVVEVNAGEGARFARALARA